MRRSERGRREKNKLVQNIFVTPACPNCFRGFFQSAAEENTTLKRAGWVGPSEEGDLARATSAVTSASAMTELASLLHDEGKLTEAEELYRCIIIIVRFEPIGLREREGRGGGGGLSFMLFGKKYRVAVWTRRIFR